MRNQRNWKFHVVGSNLEQYFVFTTMLQFSSVTHSCLTPCDPMDHSTPGLPCISPTPWVYPNSCPLSQWYHTTISSSVIPFSSCLQSFPASASFQMSQLFASGSQSIGVSALTSVLRMNTQDWSPLGCTGLISLQFKGLSRVFSNKLALSNSKKLWTMPCRATQDEWVMVERSDRMWSTGEGNGKPLQYSCRENPMNSMKRQKDRKLKDELPESVGAQYATGVQ